MTEDDMYQLHRTRPDWLPADAELDGDRVIGWALMTERVPGEQLARPTGYMVIVDGGYIETDLDGVPYRAKVLNMLEAS
jgi:hypothetical protein